MTERDGAWMARIIARFTRRELQAIVGAARFTDPGDAAYIIDVLVARQRAILERYLTRLSPLADVRREADGRICAVDLARARGVFAPGRFHYQVVEEIGDRRVQLPASPGPEGAVCFVPRPFARDGLAADDAGRRVTFRIRNVTAARPLEIHAYDLGSDGMRIVGLRRPAP